MNKSIHEISNCRHVFTNVSDYCKNVNVFVFSSMEECGIRQKVDERIIKKIHQYVAKGISSAEEIEIVIRLFVKNEIFCDDNLPTQESRRFFPLSRDMRNHMHTARNKLCLSKTDQENLHMKIIEWKKKSPKDHLFFSRATVKTGRKKPQASICFIMKMETR